MSIEAMKQALEALERCDGYRNWPWMQEAKSTLRTAIEQAEKQEPVGVVKVLPLGEGHKPMHWADWADDDNHPPEGTPLYTTPPAAPVQLPEHIEDQVMRERDEYHEMADALAAKIEEITGTHIGEHSSANCPWRNALDAADDWIASTPPAAPVQDDLAYREAVNLATWLFKKHFADEEHYASGRVVWEPCDTTAGVISQIDNMVCGLVQPAALVQEPVAWVNHGENRITRVTGWGGYGALYTTPPAAPVQEPVIDHSCKDTYELIMKWADIYAAQTGELYSQAAQDPSKAARMADERTMLACVVAQAFPSPAAQRQWVGLTDEEIAEEFYKFEAAGAWYQFARAIEAKLREKNGGGA